MPGEDIELQAKASPILINPNQKGALGEVAVSKELLRLGYEVFAEVGSHSKVDLIVLDRNHVPIKLQIKCVTSNNETVDIYSVKSCLNPKYNSVYSSEQIDIFAVYVVDKDLVFYVSAVEVLRNAKSSKFRFSASRNGQSKNVRYVADYLNLERALRDCTPYARAGSAAGDETVRTTTPNGG